jgi:S-DNA-T family DNA segregation ATPase FtsK/SpoIIIE
MFKKKGNKRGKSKETKLSWLGLSEGTKCTILGVILFLVAFFVILSFLGWAGVVGDKLAKFIKLLFGRGGFLLPVVLVVLGIAYLKSLKEKIYKLTFLGVAIFVLGILGILFLGSEVEKLWEVAKEGDGGGILGFLAAYPLLKFLGKGGGFLTMIGMILVGLLITSNASWAEIKERLAKTKSKEEKEEEEKEEEEEEEDKKKKKGLGSNFSVKGISDKLKRRGPGRPVKLEGELKVQHYEPDTTWKLPDTNILSGGDVSPEAGDVEKNAKVIKDTFENFGIEVEMGEVNIGPTVTQYTLKPAEGVKLTRITALTDDLALALAAHPVRVEAPIPGKSLVGVEVPNKKVALVNLRDVLEDKKFKDAKMNLVFGLGRNVAGETMVANLEKMPHLLVAGATGSGKSVSINSIICSLLYRNSPRQLKCIMVDPKRVELTTYNGIPHLLTPVITDSQKAVNALKWAISEMERRYELLEEAGSRNIFSFNEERKDKDEKLPFLVVIIDELADLMATKGKEVEAAIVRLAQMARAVGIHVIVSTQRPSVEVITGLIKANITSRIAFQVPTQIDSRTILDAAGAEKLLGGGDMLFISSELKKPVRIQGAFVLEKDVRKVVNFWRDQVKKRHEEEEDTEVKEEGIVNEILEGGNRDGATGTSGTGGDDALYEEAKKVVIEMQRASASLLQRRLRIGYARAARIIDMLEEDGIVSPGEGAKPRKVMVSAGEVVGYQNQEEDQASRNKWNY